MKLCLVACVLFASSTMQVVAQQRAVPRFVEAVVVQDPNKLAPETTIDLGSVLPSESVDAKVSLLNATDQEIRFNRIERTSRNTEIAPVPGKIAPGGTLELRVKLRAQDIPTRKRGSHYVKFYQGEQLVLSATFDFGFTHHVGFPVHMLTVGFGSTAQKEEVAIPVVVGSEVKDDAFTVEVEDLDIDFAYEVDRERGVLRGVLGLKGQKEFSRLYGRLTIVDLRSGRMQSIALVLERQNAVQVHPRSLRFIQPSSGSSYVANVYARCTKDGSEADLCRASAILDDVAFSCIAKRLGTSVFKIEISVSEKQVNSILSNDDDDQREPRRVKFTVKYGDTIVKRAVPFYFQKYKK